MKQQEIAHQLRSPEGETGRHFGEMMNQSNQFINQWAWQAMNLQPRDSILEIGLGNGRFIASLLSVARDTIYTGLDRSATMIEEAIQLNHQLIEQGSVKLVQGCSTRLPFPEGSFSKVLSVNTLYFWTDPEKDLSEIRRVLKPGGTLCLAFRSRECMEHLSYVQFGFRLYTQEEAADLLMQNRFKVKRVIHKKDQTEIITGQELEKDAIIVCGTKSCN